MNPKDGDELLDKLRPLVLKAGLTKLLLRARAGWAYEPDAFYWIEYLKANRN